MNHLPIFAYTGVLKFDMKIFVNVARLEIGLLYSRREAGTSVYLGHISSIFITTKVIHVQENIFKTKPEVEA